MTELGLWCEIPFASAAYIGLFVASNMSSGFLLSCFDFSRVSSAYSAFSAFSAFSAYCMSPAGVQHPVPSAEEIPGAKREAAAQLSITCLAVWPRSLPFGQGYGRPLLGLLVL